MNRIDGRYLRKLREKHGYSLREFAELVYSSKSSVQRWEQSFAPEDEELLQKIATVYSTTVEEMRLQSEMQFGKKKRDPYKMAQLRYGTILFPLAFVLLIVTVTILIIL